MRTAAGLLCATLLPTVQVAAATAADALLFSAAAGGERRNGSIASCDAERCFVDRAAVPLEDVLWIGLGVGDEAPPAAMATRGAVLADGAVHPGRFVGLSLGSVLLADEELDRALVRWVRVADVRRSTPAPSGTSWPRPWSRHRDGAASSPSS